MLSAETLFQISSKPVNNAFVHRSSNRCKFVCNSFHHKKKQKQKL